MGKQDERRKWPRLGVALKIRLKLLASQEEGSGEQFYYTKNISTGGLFFEDEAPLSVSEGSVFDVEICMPLAKYGFTSSRRLEARGKVCRLEDQASGEGRAGVALEFMAPPRFVTP